MFKIKLPEDKITDLQNNLKKLLQLVNNHCSISDTHLAKINYNLFNLDFKYLKKIWIKKINREDIQPNKYDIDILSYYKSINKIEIVDTYITDINSEKYKNLDIYYFYEKEYNIIKSIKLEINSIKNSIENHTLLENTHLNYDISEGKKKLEYFYIIIL